MKVQSSKKLAAKELIVFDLDGTLTPTKAPMDKQMSVLIKRLLAVRKVAVIGGGKYDLFKQQFLATLKVPLRLYGNLFLFPTTASVFYRYNHDWQKVYAHQLSKRQRSKIIKIFHRVFDDIGYQHPKKTYGKVIEDRGTQVTFSALGQDVVAMLGKNGIRLKEEWKQKNTPLKLKIAQRMARYLPNLEVRAAGHTSVDVTKKGIDKAFGLRQIQKYLKIPIKNMLFIGDAIFPGGNDYAVVKTGVDYIPVEGTKETKKIIRALLAGTQAA